MNLWTMLWLVILLYGVIAVILVSHMRVDLKTPWKGLVRGVPEAVTISDINWVQVAGVCADDLLPSTKRLDGMNLPPSYVVSQVSGAIQCVEICNKVHGCLAFSLSDSGSCFVTSDCVAWIPSLNYITYVRREIAANIRQRSSVRLQTPAQKVGHAPESSVVADDGCLYCPPQNPCEQPRLCRAGQCFHNLQLKDGTPCDAGDPVRIGDVCIGGVCTPPYRGGRFHRR